MAKAAEVSHRVVLFNALRRDHWYSRLIEKLSQKEIDLAVAFLNASADLNRDDFAMAVNRMFLGKPDKPKRWKEIQELLAVSNIK